MGLGRRRILFLAEAVTLAHIGRAHALACSLDPSIYDIQFASSPRYDHLLGETPFPKHEIYTMPSETFLKNLATGVPLYDVETLTRYVEDDLQLIESTRPDIVLGDFRLSLSVSARISNIPYLAVTNAYWSPYAVQRYIVPELPITRYLGSPLAQMLFNIVRPLAFALHTTPLNKVRKAFGLKGLGTDLRRIYTDADYTLYADARELVKTFDLPRSHHYLGPVAWSPEIPPPPWWDDIPSDQPIIYVTMGSSGRGGCLDAVIEGLSGLPVTVLASSAGRQYTRNLPDNVYTAEYLPGERAAARSTLVICNGGSPTCYQALAAGSPVLGLAGNLDQYLNMSYLTAAGAGVLLRSGTIKPKTIARAVTRMLDNPILRDKTARLANVLKRYDYGRNFNALLETVVSG